MLKIPPFKTFMEASKSPYKNLRILSFDPGETVGWSYFRNNEIEESGQIRTTEFTQEQLTNLETLFLTIKANVVVFETYRVYGWKTDSHAWDEVHTAQIIGIIKYLALSHNLKFKGQTAQIAKQFVTDEKMKAWDFWKPGEKHARDAIRHALYYSLFGKE